ncbi:hypothetical protein AA309_13255 [Microvirga vignae]|uniref:PilZ domain-containing protein n=1 Tax=Microvirga vignae TaxID=1225564 RepID=A0A0H1RBP9_9HYPH|nr:hypothetical protein AA309_13255 [Microvirga vignae]
MNSRISERRLSERFPTCLEGWIAGKTLGAAIACTVWDLSETGACLVIEGPADVPVDFELQIPSESAEARVRLIWTTGTHYGAEFTD